LEELRIVGLGVELKDLRASKMDMKQGKVFCGENWEGEGKTKIPFIGLNGNIIEEAHKNFGPNVKIWRLEALYWRGNILT
jgi:hypothetical protein